jgi:hypothetical protein
MAYRAYSEIIILLSYVSALEHSIVVKLILFTMDIHSTIDFSSLAYSPEHRL